MSERLPPGYDGPAPDPLAGDVQTTGDGTLTVVARFTGDAVGEVPACTPADVRAAGERARSAQER